MSYMIFDNDGNALGSFEDSATAIEAMVEIVRREPDAADELALLSYAPDGMPLGKPASGREVVMRDASEHFVLKYRAVSHVPDAVLTSRWLGPVSPSPRISVRPLTV